MKKLCILLLTVLFLTGCAPATPAETTQPATETTPAATAEPTTAPTTAPTAPTTTPTTAPTVPTTAPPTEPEPQVLDPALWWREAQHPSYEEAIAAAPTYTRSNTRSWLISEGDAGILYSLESYYPDGLFVSSSAHEEIYPIIDGETLSENGMYLAAADMEYAYMYSDSAIQKIDLLTGETLASVPCGNILSSKTTDHYMLYYAEHAGEAINICRVYLPEMKRDVLDTLEAPYSIRWEVSRSGRDETLSWRIITPELSELLEKELQNPDSSYKTLSIYEEKVDFSSAWDDEDFWDPRHLDFSGMFLFGIQQATGIPIFTEYTYCLTEGSVTTRQGIIDNCAFGTGLPHDHYNPELTRLPEYVMVNGSWQPAPGQDIRGTVSGSVDESLFFAPYGYGTDSKKLYLVRNGRYTPYADFTLTNETVREDARYGVTDDNRLVQISHDGSLCNTLYAGKDTLVGFAFYENSVYFSDGDSLIELDLTTNQYRVILKQESIKEIRLWKSQGKTLIGIAAYAGLAIRQLGYNPVTGTVEQITGMLT